MVAAGSLFLLCLSASSHHRPHHGSSKDVRRHATPLLGIKPSSSSLSSGPRRADRKKSFLSAPSDDVEGQLNDGGAILQIDARDLPWETLFSLLKQFQKRERHSNVPRLHQEDGSNLGLWVHTQRYLKTTGKLDPDRQTRLEEIGFQWATSTTWDDMYALLKQFQKREGHSFVPRSHKEDGANLGRWVGTQRGFQESGKLDRFRQHILDEVGLEWVLFGERVTVPWGGMYGFLKQFQKREGHCNVPQSHKEDGLNLGLWVHTQRWLKMTGKLDLDRQTLLEELGFEWAILVPWEEMFSLLKQFQKREGQCNVPRSHQEDGFNLGLWVHIQRRLKTTGKLDPDREMRLEEIGFEWAILVPWEEVFSLLQQFQKREGHCNVRQSHQENGVNLGSWVSTQRYLKRRGS
jgi:hypothetical protein